MIEELILLSFCATIISLIWIWFNHRLDGSFVSILPNHREFFFMKDLSDINKSPQQPTTDVKSTTNLDMPRRRITLDGSSTKKNYLPSNLLPFNYKEVKRNEIKPVKRNSAGNDSSQDNKVNVPSLGKERKTSSLLESIQKEGEEHYEKQKKEEKEKKKQEREKREKEREEKAKLKQQEESKQETSSTSKGGLFQFNFKNSGNTNTFNFAPKSTTSSSSTTGTTLNLGGLGSNSTSSSTTGTTLNLGGLGSNSTSSSTTGTTLNLGGFGNKSTLSSTTGTSLNLGSFGSTNNTTSKPELKFNFNFGKT